MVILTPHKDIHLWSILIYVANILLKLFERRILKLLFLFRPHDAQDFKEMGVMSTQVIGITLISPQGCQSSLGQSKNVIPF